MNNMPLATNLIIVGMVVVFIVLVILIAMIYLFSNVLNIKRKRPGDSIASDEAAVLEIDDEDAGLQADADIKLKETADGNELIAVLTAAIYASFSHTPGIKLKVKSYRRVNSNSPVWNAAGRKEQLSGKL